MGCYFEGGTWSIEVLGVWEVRRDKACPKNISATAVLVYEPDDCEPLELGFFFKALSVKCIVVLSASRVRSFMLAFDNIQLLKTSHLVIPTSSLGLSR